MHVATQNEVQRRPVMVAIWHALFSLCHRARGTSRRLRVCESLSLGEKRFIAVVQFETQQFLIGGGAQSVSLLARLGESADFAEVLTEWCERQR